jgi:peptidoglycan biosynthesis protein MviN/MurJ (putative lipid II flippase)
MNLSGLRVLKVFSVSAIMGAIAYQVYHFLNSILIQWSFLNSKIFTFFSMTIAAILAMIIYAALLYWWKYPERDMIAEDRPN